MSEEIGRIRETLGELRGAVENLTRTWADQDRKATEGRRDLYRKVEEMGRELTAVIARVDRFGEQLGELRPQVLAADIRHHRSSGAKATLTLVWSLFIGGLGAIAYLLDDFLAFLIPPKH